MWVQNRHKIASQVILYFQYSVFHRLFSFGFFSSRTYEYTARNISPYHFILIGADKHEIRQTHTFRIHKHMVTVSRRSWKTCMTNPCFIENGTAKVGAHNGTINFIIIYKTIALNNLNRWQLISVWFITVFITVITIIGSAIPISLVLHGDTKTWKNNVHTREWYALVTVNDCLMILNCKQHVQSKVVYRCSFLVFAIHLCLGSSYASYMV